MLIIEKSDRIFKKKCMFFFFFVKLCNILECSFLCKGFFLTCVELLFIYQDELHADEVCELTLVTVQEIVNAWCGIRLRN